MPLNLATRIGPDTVGKLELAARRRYAEARLLMPTEPLGAIYLFGYSVEMRLKCAYFRTVGLVSASGISAARKTAETVIRQLSPGRIPGHNLLGWARVLEQARAQPGLAPMVGPLLQQMNYHVQNIELCWTEVLRYRGNKPYNKELEAVESGATWFKNNYRRLRS